MENHLTFRIILPVGIKVVNRALALLFIPGLFGFGQSEPDSVFTGFRFAGAAFAAFTLLAQIDDVAHSNSPGFGEAFLDLRENYTPNPGRL